MMIVRRSSTSRRADRSSVHEFDGARPERARHCAYMKRGPAMHRPGFSLMELVLVMTLAGLASVGVVSALSHHLDRLAARHAIAEAAGALSRARDEALARRAVVRVRIDTAQRTLTVRSGSERIARHALGHAHGVTLSTTRDSIAFDVRGLGHGAANLTLIARRGRAADTLVVSRLGRVRY